MWKTKEQAIAYRARFNELQRSYRAAMTLEERHAQDKRSNQGRCKEKQRVWGKSWYHTHKNDPEFKLKRSIAAKKRYAAGLCTDGWLKNRYGITDKERQDLLVKQNNLCAICNGTQITRNRTLSVDHDHKTGRIRGLLCTHCNWLLGNAKDNINILNAAIEYLKREAN